MLHGLFLITCYCLSHRTWSIIVHPNIAGADSLSFWIQRGFKSMSNMLDSIINIQTHYQPQKYHKKTNFVLWILFEQNFNTFGNLSTGNKPQCIVKLYITQWFIIMRYLHQLHTLYLVGGWYWWHKNARCCRNVESWSEIQWETDWQKFNLKSLLADLSKMDLSIWL